MVLDGIKNAPGAPHEPSADVAIVQYATRAVGPVKRVSIFTLHTAV